VRQPYLTACNCTDHWANMLWSSSRGLFLTWTGRDIFLFYSVKVHIIILYGKLQFIYVERKDPYVEWWLLVRSCESPCLLVSCPKSTAPFETPYPRWQLPPSPTSCQYMQQTTLACPYLLLSGTLTTGDGGDESIKAGHGHWTTVCIGDVQYLIPRISIHYQHVILKVH
jgi:hypothetical protein